MDYPHGQHRWVEFKDIHNHEVTSVPPEWHGWLTQMQDTPGGSVQSFIDEKLGESHQVAGDDCDSSKMYTDNVGLNASNFEMGEVLNYSSYRQRGYKIGGLNMLPGDKDKFHVHAGHALNKGSTTRYDSLKKMHLWDPEESEETPKPIRSLDVN